LKRVDKLLDPVSIDNNEIILPLRVKPTKIKDTLQYNPNY